MTTENNLGAKVDEWLQRQGYPLEFATASAFFNAGFHVWQGHYVEDCDTPREIDVIAVRDTKAGTVRTRVEFVVECKWSADKPWVVFSSRHSRIARTACIAQTLGSQAAMTAMWARASDPRLQSLGVFETPDCPGFGGRQALSDNRDVFYEALKSISSLAYTVASRYDRNIIDPADYLEMPVAVFPVIVLRGKLFLAVFDEESADLRTREVSSARIHWRGSNKWCLNTTIDIVTEGELLSYVKRRREDADSLGHVISESIAELKKCVRLGDIRKWPVLKGSRGFLDHPPLLKLLSRRVK